MSNKRVIVSHITIEKALEMATKGYEFSWEYQRGEYVCIGEVRAEKKPA